MAGLYDKLGQSNLNIFSGQVLEDFLREFHGKQGYKRYNEMRANSPIVGALLLAIENAVRGVKFQWTSDLVQEAEAKQRQQDSEEAAKIGAEAAKPPKPPNRQKDVLTGVFGALAARSFSSVATTPRALR